jgi:signal transduction histidine kinase
VAHSLSVVVTLADGASTVSKSDPSRANEAMEQVSAVGRKALIDMRSLIGVLRADTREVDLAPAPTLDQLGELFDQVRATGLNVSVERQGEPFTPGAAAALTLYRITQEALTNTLKHAGATNVKIVLSYESPFVNLEVIDDGANTGSLRSTDGSGPGSHGIQGMRERARLHEGTLQAGPGRDGGWVVSATLRDSTLLTS